MKKTSKVITLMLAAAMALSVTACGSQTTETTGAASETTATEAAPAEESAGAETQGESAQASSTDGGAYKIGVLQLVQHTALDAANEGFIAALNDAGIKYEVDQQNASGDQSTCVTVASKFSNDKKDLILAIATPAAQAMAGAVSDTPILVTAVTDPAESGLVDKNETPGAMLRALPI